MIKRFDIMKTRNAFSWQIHFYFLIILIHDILSTRNRINKKKTVIFIGNLLQSLRSSALNFNQFFRGGINFYSHIFFKNPLKCFLKKNWGSIRMWLKKKCRGMNLERLNVDLLFMQLTIHFGKSVLFTGFFFFIINISSTLVKQNYLKNSNNLEIQLIRQIPISYALRK